MIISSSMVRCEVFHRASRCIDAQQAWKGCKIKHMTPDQEEKYHNKIRAGNLTGERSLGQMNNHVAIKQIEKRLAEVQYNYRRPGCTWILAIVQPVWVEKKIPTGWIGKDWNSYIISIDVVFLCKPSGQMPPNQTSGYPGSSPFGGIFVPGPDNIDDDPYGVAIPAYPHPGPGFYDRGFPGNKLGYPDYRLGYRPNMMPGNVIPPQHNPYDNPPAQDHPLHDLSNGLGRLGLNNTTPLSAGRRGSFQRPFVEDDDINGNEQDNDRELHVRFLRDMGLKDRHGSHMAGQRLRGGLESRMGSTDGHDGHATLSSRPSPGLGFLSPDRRRRQHERDRDSGYGSLWSDGPRRRNLVYEERVSPYDL